MLVAPSLLSANFANLQADFEMLNSSNADYLHVDVMDGVFVHSTARPKTARCAHDDRRTAEVHIASA